MERRLTSERTKDIIHNKKKNSKVYGRTLYGFDKVGNGLVKNKNEMKERRKINKPRDKVNSYHKISEFLN